MEAEKPHPTDFHSTQIVSGGEDDDGDGDFVDDHADAPHAPDATDTPDPPDAPILRRHNESSFDRVRKL